MDFWLVDLIILSFAAWQWTLIIRESSLFADTRSWLQAKSTFMQELLSCGWCTSVHAAIHVCAAWVILTELRTVSEKTDSPILAGFLYTCVICGNIVLSGLAVSRMSNVLHDIWQNWILMDEYDDDEDDD